MRTTWSTLLALLLLCFRLHATHIVGGEMIYNYLGNDRYEIKFQYYLDCVNGNPGAILSDTTASIVVFNSDTVISQHFVYRNQPVRLNETNYTCVSALGNVCVDLYVYDTILTLPPIAGGYDVVYQRCCRNNSILNLIDPGGTGSTYITHISGTETKIDSNSSPRFNKLPPNYLCLNEILDFDHSASDPDGDSLYYTIRTPYAGATAGLPLPVIPFIPLDSVIWRSPYSDTLPLPVRDSLFLNQRTGRLLFTPNRQGQHVFGICVEEYRDGKKIGETLRDYQFNILPCDIRVQADFTAPEPNCSTQVFFTNKSLSADSFFWDFGDGTSVVGKSPEHLFPDTGTFQVKLVAFDGNCKDSITQPVTVLDDGHVLGKRELSFCNDQEISLQAAYFPNGDYVWHIDPDHKLSDKHIAWINPGVPGEYWVEIKLVNCHFVDSFVVVRRSPQFPDLPSLICDSTYEIDLSAEPFGGLTIKSKTVDVDLTNMVSPRLIFPTKGRHHIHISYVKHGCADSTDFMVDVFGNEDTSKSETFNVCRGDSVSLAATYYPEATYTWLNLADELTHDSAETYSGIPIKNGRVTTQISLTDDCYVWNQFDVAVLDPKARMQLESSPHCLGTRLAFWTSPAASSATELSWTINDSFYDSGTAPEPYFVSLGTDARVQLLVSEAQCRDSVDTLISGPKAEVFSFEIPNVITPNDDDQNECFTIYSEKDLTCHNYELFIYNRWGELMYEQHTEKQTPCWKGVNQRTNRWVLTGTYFYILFVDGEPYNGTVTVLR